jgi:DNA-damage-inducible protein J
MAEKQTVSVTIQLDRDVKMSVEKLFDDFGMNLSTAFNIFVRQTLRSGKIPFEICDPFYSEQNQTELRQRARDIENGVNIAYHELAETEDEYTLAQ